MHDKKPPARVVLVEDHTMVRQLFAHLVRDDLGLTLAADCTTVAEGQVALVREQPDLAIVDWMLPDGRGFDLVRSVGPKLPRTRWARTTKRYLREREQLACAFVVLIRIGSPSAGGCAYQLSRTKSPRR